MDTLKEKPDSKKKRARPTSQHIEAAIREVLQAGQTIRSVARVYGISKSYLASLCKKARNQDGEYHHKPNIGNKRIFSIEQETYLADYLKTCSKMCFGLTTVQVRELAYQYAKAQNISPEIWTQKKWLPKNGCVRL